ncbi:MAG: calcium/sodium antiporter [Desulfomicrobium sp.]
MVVPFLALCLGLAVLVWSADRFIDGAASVARHFSMPPLLIGMIVVGFGTSAPEMVVSALAAMNGTPGIALGNAFGSNITNIALILGFTALLKPIEVHSQVLRKELPLLTAMTAVTAYLVHEGTLARADALIMLAFFAALMFWTVRQGMQAGSDAFGDEMGDELCASCMPLKSASFWLFAGLALLVASSRLLVWGAVEIAHALGVSDLIIGLTVVALGTSLPELASSVIASRKGEHDIALGNVLGSNLFNTLAVVGIAGVIHPMEVEPDVISRDIPVMTALTLSLFLIGFRFKRPGRINRYAGGALLACYVGYTAFLVKTTLIP